MNEGAGNGRVGEVIPRAALELQSDERLVELARAGSDSAFEVIVERYRAPLVQYCSRLLGTALAEDAVQQTFLAVYSLLGREERQLKLKPWLYRVAHNASIDTLRRKTYVDEEFDEGLVAQPPELLERDEKLRLFFERAHRLPKRERAVLVLREFEGRSFGEIAEALGTTEPAVNQLLYRARARLRSLRTPNPRSIS